MFVKQLFYFLLLSSLTLIPAAVHAKSIPVRTKNVVKFDSYVIHCDMPRKDALLNLDPDCPNDIQRRQRLVPVQYYSFDGNVCQGQILIDKALVEDIRKVFKVILEEKVPLTSVVPIAAPEFLKDGRWDDNLSMEANNTSAFNYRHKTSGGSLSNHALGYAIDINPWLNPYIKGETILPSGAEYNPAQPGTFTKDHPVVKKFLELGWEWGGNWTSLKDYQHFEKFPKN